MFDINKKDFKLEEQELDKSINIYERLYQQAQEIAIKKEKSRER